MQYSKYLVCVIESHIEKPEREFGCPTMRLASLFPQHVRCLYLIWFIDLVVRIGIVDVLHGRINFGLVLLSDAITSYLSLHHPSMNNFKLMIIW